MRKNFGVEIRDKYNEQIKIVHQARREAYYDWEILPKPSNWKKYKETLVKEKNVIINMGNELGKMYPWIKTSQLTDVAVELFTHHIEMAYYYGEL